MPVAVFELESHISVTKNNQINSMKKMTTISLTALLSFAFLFSKAQAPKEACALITDEQINKIIGCKVAQQGGVKVKGMYCKHTGADFKSEVAVQYYDWHSEKTASDMQKLNYDGDKKDIAGGKKAGGIYTAVKDLSDEGPYAYVATGDGDIYTNGNVVRIQFFVGAIQYTFDTKGIPMSKVLPKAKEICNTIRNNSK